MTPADALYRRIGDSFARQGLMRGFGAKIVTLAPGLCTLRAPVTDAVTQQHGAAHAGLTFALGDTAAGYAALTLLPEGQEVMTAEIKINLLRPGLGTHLLARGEVVKTGRRLCVVRAEVFAQTDGQPDGSDTLIAVMLGTMVPVDP